MPRKKIRVRDHDRRKPRQSEEIHVREYQRTMELVVPRGHEADYLKARRKFDKRPARSRAQDLRFEAKETGLVDDKEHLERWMRAPNVSDVAGIDEPHYGPKLENLDVVKQILQERLQKFSRKSSEIVRKARTAIAKVKERKIPAREKKERVTRIKKQAKKEIDESAREGLKELKKTRGFVDRVTRVLKKWTFERRRRANYVAETTKCNTIQADALIRRARLKGWDYDTVDWDQLQGKDLQYEDRVVKLEKMIGKTYTEDEYEGLIKSEEQRWNDLMEQRKQEIDKKAEYQPYKPEQYEIPPAMFGYS